MTGIVVLGSKDRTANTIIIKAMARKIPRYDEQVALFERFKRVLDRTSLTRKDRAKRIAECTLNILAGEQPPNGRRSTLIDLDKSLRREIRIRALRLMSGT